MGKEKKSRLLAGKLTEYSVSSTTRGLEKKSIVLVIHMVNKKNDTKMELPDESKFFFLHFV